MHVRLVVLYSKFRWVNILVQKIHNLTGLIRPLLKCGIFMYSILSKKMIRVKFFIRFMHVKTCVPKKSLLGCGVRGGGGFFIYFRNVGMLMLIYR